jgi:potassium channel subfamily K
MAKMPGPSMFATDFSLAESHNNDHHENSSTRPPSPLHNEPENHGMKPSETPSHRIAWVSHAPPKAKREDSDSPTSDEKRPKFSNENKSSFFSSFSFRGYDDEDNVDWWFASTACPLLAATIAPLANVLSIAALVTYWRMNVSDGNGGLVPDFEGHPFKDPRWCTGINAGSLVCGFLGNIFLLFNFTGRIRYIVALPASIVLFYLANFMVCTYHFIPIERRI